MDIDADEKIDFKGFRTWRSTVEIRDNEDEIGKLMKSSLDPLMQSIDHDGDNRISLPELRALSV